MLWDVLFRPSAVVGQLATIVFMTIDRRSTSKECCACTVLTSRQMSSVHLCMLVLQLQPFVEGVLAFCYAKLAKSASFERKIPKPVSTESCSCGDPMQDKSTTVDTNKLTDHLQSSRRSEIHLLSFLLWALHAARTAVFSGYHSCT